MINKEKAGLNISRMPNLAWFMAFKAVVDRQSFTLASRDLHLTQPAISQQIAKLEALLKTQLFFRNSRSVIVTEEGQRLYEQLDKPLNALLHIVEEFHESSQVYPLNIETEPVFNRLFISTYLPDFLACHNHVRVKQVLTTHHLDFMPETELAIKWGQGDWEGFDAQRLLDLNYLPVCSPAYGQAHQLRVVHNLTKAVLIHERDTSDWQYWNQYHAIPSLDVNQGHIAGESDVVMSMAIAGVGVALCAKELVKAHIASGALVFPFPDLPIKHHKAYYILTRRNRRLSKEAVSFIRFLNKNLARQA